MPNITTEWKSFPNSSANATNDSAATFPGGLLFLQIIIMFATIIGNGLILVVFACSKRLRTPFNLYICNLALADFIVGAIPMNSLIVYNVYGETWPGGRFFCSLWIYSDWHMTFESTLCLASVSLDRFWSVHWPVSYKRHASVNRTIQILLTTWFYAHFVFFPYYLYDRVNNIYGETDCGWDFVQNKRFCLPVAIMGYYLPLGAMIYFNCSIARFITKRSKMIAADHEKNAAVERRNSLAVKKNHELASAPSKDKSRKQRQPLVTLGIITTCALICWSPWVVYFTIAPQYPTALPDVLNTISFWMCYINSTINPYLYISTSDEFRKVLRRLCGRKGTAQLDATSLAHSATQKMSTISSGHDAMTARKMSADSLGPEMALTRRPSIFPQTAAARRMSKFAIDPQMAHDH